MTVESMPTIDRDKLIRSMEMCLSLFDTKCEECLYGPKTDVCMYRMMSDAEQVLKREQPKKRESRAKLPCPCGRIRLEMWYGGNGTDYVKCPNCGREASGKTEIAAIRAWNEMVRKESENDG